MQLERAPFPNQNQPSDLKSPTDLLWAHFTARRERNSAYSMSAFSRDLGVSSSLISKIFSGCRPISLKLGIQLSGALELNTQDSNAFISAILKTSGENSKISKKVRVALEKKFAQVESSAAAPEYTSLEIERFKIIAEWHHLAIFTLIETKNFRNDPNWIAEQLGIAIYEARDGVERLINVGLVEQTPKGLRQLKRNLDLFTQQSEVAVRKFHTQMIKKASDILKKNSPEDFKNRLVNGITFSCGPEHLEVIKDKINRLEDEILALTEKSVTQSVYQMNVQFFPLTQLASTKS